MDTDIFARYLRSLPAGWFETFNEAIRLCETLNRPRRDSFELLSRLSGILPMFNVFSPDYTMALFASLKRDSGLDDWDALADLTDPRLRLMTACNARARATHKHRRRTA